MPSGEPWKVLRVVIEVRVPPKTPATEKDLIARVRELLPDYLLLPYATHPRRQRGALRFKSFASFWPAHAREQGWRKPSTIRIPVTAGGVVANEDHGL
jgi:hypothetical protein